MSNIHIGGGGGGGTPGGVDTNVQYNNNGAFGGDNLLTWDYITHRLGVGLNNPARRLQVRTESLDPPGPGEPGLSITSVSNSFMEFTDDGGQQKWNGGAGTYWWWLDVGSGGNPMMFSTLGPGNGSLICTPADGIYAFNSQNFSAEMLDGTVDAWLARSAAGIVGVGGNPLGTTQTNTSGKLIADQLTTASQDGNTVWDSYHAYFAVVAPVPNDAKTAISTGTNGVVYTTTSRDSGTWTARFVPTIVSDVGIGFATDYSANGGTNSLGSGAQYAVYKDGQVQAYGAPTGDAGDPFVSGDTVDIAISIGDTSGTGLWWYRVNGGNWNGNPTANPNALTGGFTYFPATALPLRLAVNLSAAGDKVTADFAPGTIGSYLNWSSGTALGAIFFNTGNGRLLNDPNNFIWDTTNHRLGINTNAPAYPLEVVSPINDSTVGALKVTSYVNHKALWLEGRDLGRNGISFTMDCTSIGGNAYDFFSTGDGNGTGICFGVFDEANVVTPWLITTFVAGGMQQIVNSLGVYGWSAGTTFGPQFATTSDVDVGLSRIAPLVVGVGNGTQGDVSGILAATMINLTPTTVTGLGLAGTIGRHAVVTDGDPGLAWGATVVNSGGGTTPYSVWDNGTNWTVVGT